jgi:hypothetical protein
VRWKIYIYICKDSNGREAYYDSRACERNKAKKKNAVKEARAVTTFQREGLRLQLHGRGCQLLSSATSSRCSILLRRSSSVMGSSSQRFVHHLQAGQLDVAQAVAGVCSVLPRAVRPTGQVKHSVPVHTSTLGLCTRSTRRQDSSGLDASWPTCCPP